ncbi:hypothetical protein [Variovorax sp. UMC13]|uniref:hypothetical protein n=1 Tax=Variovorax sp. UMC13 TaxID=1862326 RepID=UPI00160106E7|nr:hypothetical protein [Variovorax sp. UMC13]MBB1600782.1 hypothetical protein [Variovorax sp. UMC13]
MTIAKPQDDEPQDVAGPLDAIGPHGQDTPVPGATVSGGGAEDRAPLNFDDDEIYAGRGNMARTGGTTHAKGGDSGRLGPPSEQFSDRNQPSDSKPAQS